MKDMRKIVQEGYDKGDYQQFYRTDDSLNSCEKRFMKKFTELISKNAKVLDLGSGIGLPYDKHLVKEGYSITGIDISQKHVDTAKENVPQAKYIKGDFSTLKFNEKFNAIISFYAIFHIPREEHKALFEKINSLLTNKGVILITMGADDMKLAVDDFVGSKMAWSSYSIEENKRLVEKAGFKILYFEEEKEKEHHLWILAQKV
ncbi:class I SAM-dependent methyltransferase [Candidatus Woesearchaeota archaeon]|nr:class I SAM-dependent methyltransferase [Candidatus Woesearchaeota archaeon]